MLNVLEFCVEIDYEWVGRLGLSWFGEEHESWSHVLGKKKNNVLLEKKKKRFKVLKKKKFIICFLIFWGGFFIYWNADMDVDVVFLILYFISHINIQHATCALRFLSKIFLLVGWR